MSGVFPNSGVPASSTTGGIANPNLVDGCVGLWYSTNRCTPRFDPTAMNNMISEIVNLVNCSGIAYDCNVYTNVCTAVTKITNDKIFGCLDRDFANASGACSIEQLVLITETNGCKRIARYSADAATVGTASFSKAHGNNHPETFYPFDPTDFANYYEYSALVADIIANTVNTVKANHTMMALGDFTLNCNSIVEIEINGGFRFMPSQNSPNGATSFLVPRIDGQFIVSGPNNQLLYFPQEVTNFNRTINSSIRISLPAGFHTISFHIVRVGSLPAVQGVGFSAPNGDSNWNGWIRITS